MPCRAVAAVGSTTCAINVTLLGLSLLISNSPALDTIQDAVLVSLNWTGGITSADVKPSLARFMHIHMDGAYLSNSCICAHSVRYRHCIREWQKPVLWLVVDLSYCTNQSGKKNYAKVQNSCTARTRFSTNESAYVLARILHEIVKKINHWDESAYVFARILFCLFDFFSTLNRLSPWCMKKETIKNWQ